MTTTNLELGAKARDRISGFEGTLTGRFEYLNGCIRWQLSGHRGAGPDLEPKDYIFDEEQVELVTADDKAPRGAPSGGPRDLTPPARA